MSERGPGRQAAERLAEVTRIPEPAPRAPAPPRRGCLGSLVALLGVVVGAAYLANPTAGILELIPDNAPLFGNLDEAGATTLLILGLQYLFGRNRRDP
jgi:hypothetical protein